MTNEILHISETIKKSKKVIYIEGIRGMAAFMVVIHHYLLAFYPAQASGVASNAHFGSLELFYHKSPFIFLTNGQLFVYIFFILSGYVLSKKFFREKNMDYLVSASVRRFPRLYIPVAFALILAYIVLKLSLNFNLEASVITKSVWLASLEGNPSVFHFLAKLLFRAMFLGDNSYITVLWTISIELYGSFLVFSALALTRNLKNSWFIFIAIFIVLALSQKFEYCAFILGIILNYTDDFEVKKILHKRFIVAILLIAGIFLGGFPHIHPLSTPTITGTFYGFLNYALLIKVSGFINAAGAFLLILAIQQSPNLQRFFSSKALAFLGNISFSMYLIHAIVIRTFTCFVFIKTFSTFGYNVSFLVAFIPSIILIFFLSYYMTNYVDKKSLDISQSVYKRYFSK